MRKVFSVFAVLSVLFGCANCVSLSLAQDINVSGVITVLQEGIKDIDDISISLTQSNKSGEINTSFQGTLQFKTPNKFRAEIDIYYGSAHTMRSLSVYDGSVLWQEQTDIKSGKITVFKSQMQGAAPQAQEFLQQFNPKEQVQSLLRDYSVLSVREDNADGLKYVIEMEIKSKVRQKMAQRLKAFSKNKDAEALIADRAVLCWDTSMQYLSSLRLYSKNQKMNMLSKYTKTKINAGLDNQVFTYVPAKGARVIDMSRIMAKETVKQEFEGAEHELVGTDCPEFSLSNIWGDRINSHDLRGKVVILNFWESWCPPCKKEMPLLEELFQNVFESEVQLITITKDEEKALRVVEENGYSFPVLIDDQAQLAKQLKVSSIPRTFVLDTRGVVRAVYIGYHADIKDILTEQIMKWKIDE